MKPSILVLVICLGAACSQRQDLTDPSPPNGGIDPLSDMLPSQICVTASPADAGAPPPIVAVWDGYMEQTFGATGDDQVHVVVRSSDTGQLSATAVFGVPTSFPPPATSETCDPVDPGTTTATTSAGSLQLLEGFEYQLTGVAMSDVRLQFNVPTYQPLANWCACQVPLPDATTPACLPEGGADWHELDGGTQCIYTPNPGPHSTQTFLTSCCRLQRCFKNECLCDKSGCAYNAQFWTPFDLSINGTHADGTALHLIRTQ